MASLGGSFYSKNIEDYYLTPYDLGYGPFVKFDHDFVGREALEKIAANPQRQKVTLVWNGDDVARVFRIAVHDAGDITKYIDLPLANYATLPYDKVRQGRQDRRPLDVHRLHATTSARCCRSRCVDDEAQRSRAPRSRWSGAKRAAARRSRPSSATSRSKCAPRCAGADLGSRARRVPAEVIADARSGRHGQFD